MASQRGELKHLGRLLGTNTGWDGDPGQGFWVYDFVPAKGIELSPCDTLFIDEPNGYYVAQDKDGNELSKHDMVTLLHAIPRDAT